MHGFRRYAVIAAATALTMIAPLAGLVGTASASTTVVVKPSAMNGWLFYNDETDVIDNSLGSFVTGPGTPTSGLGSAEISVTGTQRRNLATYQFGGTPLASITDLAFSTYNPSAGNPGSSSRSGYLQFNVDFTGSSSSFQRRLVYVPSANTTVTQDNWKSWDAIAGGAALWLYSGTTWPAPNAADAGTTAKTWTEILADYPLARILTPDAQLSIRVGEPYADGYTENIDSLTFGTGAGTTLFDFEPETQCTTVCYVDDATGNDAFGGDTPGSAKKTIQAAVSQVSPGGTVDVAAGTYNEDVVVTTPGIQLLGAGIDVSTIVGPKGNAAVTTLGISATGVTVDGFTVTRDGNNVADWNNANGTLNSNGVILDGSGSTLQNSKVTGNRNGVYVESVNGVTIANNTIDDNRTGLHLVDDVSGLSVTNNFITNNWTMGILFRDQSSPNPTGAVAINDNKISGNWYSQVEARSFFSAPALDVTNNWLGTTAPTEVSAANSSEPGYSVQIPMWFGGPDIPPAGSPTIVWNGTPGNNLTNPVDFDPYLCSGTDTSPAIGFQPAAGTNPCPVPVIDVANDPSVTEGNAGDVTMTFTVTPSTASTGLAMSVDYTTDPGTATEGVDYLDATGTLTWAPNDGASQNVQVTVKGDAIDEFDETLTLVLSNPVNDTIGDGSGTGTILDNDPRPRVSIQDTGITEPESGTAQAHFRVKLSKASGKTVKVRYTTADGSAVAPSDYTTKSGTVTFLPGQTSKTINIAVKGDTHDEPNETFFVNLFNPTNASISDPNGSCVIRNNGNDD